MTINKVSRTHAKRFCVSQAYRFIFHKNIIIAASQGFRRIPYTSFLVIAMLIKISCIIAPFFAVLCWFQMKQEVIEFQSFANIYCSREDVFSIISEPDNLPRINHLM